MFYPILITAMMAYLLGNLNGSFLTSMLVAQEDVRTHGSGNAGLTNFIRNYGAASATMVVGIDAGKALLACLAGGLIFEPLGYRMEGMMLGAAGVMLGHDFPVAMGFRGGKGILSGWFVAWAVDWRVAVILITVFALAYGLTQYVSLGSILAAASFSVSFIIFHHDNLWVMIPGVLLGLLTIWMHRANVVRLLKGQERKTNLFAKGGSK